MTAGAPVNYSANNMNQYASVGGQPYTYTPDGGLTSDGTWSYTYDDDDQLTQAQGPGVTARYAYDPFHRRISKSINGAGRQFLYQETGDIPTLLGEADGAGNLETKYVFYGLSPLAMIVSNTVFTLHCDHLERPVLATDEGGATAWESAFSAFGQPSLGPTNRVIQPLRAPGQYEDSESGLHYNLARHYDPKTGRFLSEDPALEAGSPLFTEVHEQNAYAYVRNNPINNIDPNGQSLLIVCSAGLPLCSAALICSLNIGACSGGLICSANVGVCSGGIACSATAAGACSGGVACSANVGLGASVCSGSGLACSAQIGIGVGSACSATLYACSGQVGTGIGSACSATVAGVCSGQAGIGNAVCSAQVAGACSGQAGPGAFACSVQVVGACSAQAGIGPTPSACSAQGAGVCSAQTGAGSGNSYCSAQGAGACSAQSGVGGGASYCSAQGAGGCSANGGGACSAQGAGPCSGATCPKNSNLWRRQSDPESLYALDPHRHPAVVSGLRIVRSRAGGLEFQLAGSGFRDYEILARDALRPGWRSLGRGPVIPGAITHWAGHHAGNEALHSVRVRLVEAGGQVQEFGPFPLPEAGNTQPDLIPWHAASSDDDAKSSVTQRRFFAFLTR